MTQAKKGSESFFWTPLVLYSEMGLLHPWQYI